ncbi:MAG: hypothetical protein LBJ17_05625 [Dysgonamonadaceae bacterium]|jgi:uncharacterized protein (TIGR02145 family)|nr:hypothetical protein [Dysgonamonadaceae bacterium]
MKKIFLTMTALFMLSASCATAQVTIGSLDKPQSFSLLELEGSGGRGLRLPQMTTAQRKTMQATPEFTAKATTDAIGLQIFNTTTKCVETWNGVEWILACECNGITFPAFSASYSFCADQNATISDLTEKVDRDVSWYYSETGSYKYASDDVLDAQTVYWAEQSIGNCVSPTRTPVSVNIYSCGNAVSSVRNTTFTNVMYDFQHQTLEAYDNSYLVPTITDVIWEYSTDNGSTFSPVPDAPNSAFFTVPAHFADAFFYGSDGKTAAKGSNTLLKVALLNLGQSADWDGRSPTDTGEPPVYTFNGDAGDLGDFYQWGRVADGHQNTVWRKGPTYKIDSILPMTGGANNTSAVVDRQASGITYNINHQLDTSNDDTYKSSFISQNNIGDWGDAIGQFTPYWGDASNYSSRTADISLAGWTYRDNNPCPSGWRVPSGYNFWDLKGGVGTDQPSGSNYYSVSEDNNWAWRAPYYFPGYSSTLTIMGGVLVTNADGEILYFPTSGFRESQTGLHKNVSEHCAYWSSTSYNSTYPNVIVLSFYNNSLYAGNGSYTRSYGLPVRCVADKKETKQ